MAVDHAGLAIFFYGTIINGQARNGIYEQA